MAMQWQCNGNAMAMQWLSNGYALAKATAKQLPLASQESYDSVSFSFNSWIP